MRRSDPHTYVHYADLHPRTRKRCDLRGAGTKEFDYNLHPRTSSEVRQGTILKAAVVEFTSTHPSVRGATRLVIWLIRGYQFTSTHLVRDATPFGKRPCRMRIVYIHTPRERCDLSEELTNEISMRFTSTHLVRGATLIQLSESHILSVYIHAPRERCDHRTFV